MAITESIPENRNFLSPLGFKFDIKKTPDVNYFVQSVNIPSVTLGETNVPTPFVKLPFAGDHIQYGALVVTFRVDEEMRNYMELFTWLRETGFPNSFSEYKSIDQKEQNKMSGQGIYSDASLLILNSARKPIVEVNFRKLYPVTLTDLQFDARNVDVDYIDTTCSFNFQTFDINWLI